MEWAEIYAVNYDFIPTVRHFPKTLWVTLKFHPPRSLEVGMMVRIVSRSGCFTPSNECFIILDIIGMRIALKRVDCSLVSCNFRDRVIPFTRNFRSVPGHRPSNFHNVEVMNDTAPYLPSYGCESSPYGVWGYATRDPYGLPGANRNWTYGQGDSISYLVW